MTRRRPVTVVRARGTRNAETIVAYNAGGRFALMRSQTVTAYALPLSM